MEYDVGFKRRFLHFASIRRFNLFEVTLIALITVTFYTVVLTCVATNSSLFCSFGHGSAGSVSYINFEEYKGDTCESRFKERIDESKRVLSSVKSELLRVSKKMKEIHVVTDELNQTIPQKQQQVAELDEQIGAAERRFNELKEAKNVRVYLPDEPLVNRSPLLSIPPNTSSPMDAFDYSRCSITSFMPIFLEELTETEPAVVQLHKAISERAKVVKRREEACLILQVTSNPSALVNTTLRNHVVVATTDASQLAPKAILFHPGRASPVGSSVHLNLPPPDQNLWKELAPLLPYKRTNLFMIYLKDEDVFESSKLDSALSTLRESVKRSEETVKVIRCGQKGSRNECADSLATSMRSSTFCVFTSSDSFQEDLWRSLKAGCIPVILSTDQELPFQQLIDWKLSTIRLPPARLPELHFLLRSWDPADLVEKKRMGRVVFERYLADTVVVSDSILAYVANRLFLLLPPEVPTESKPLFEDSYKPKLVVPANVVIAHDDEYLGPLEAPLASESFRHNLSYTQMYSYGSWNGRGSHTHSPEFLINAVELPAEAEFHEDTKSGYRPILPGTGEEFSKALGGNRQREHFTIVLITYNRDGVLVKQLERLNKLPYLNKVIVVWNNVGREPMGGWPKIHVPVEFIKAARNSLNNRFEPWDRIETEAVLSLDDDIELRQHEISLAFRIWRESRDQIVGFPARYHARYGEEMYYNSNHTCQYSMILTGAAFMHKSYFYEYSRRMQPAIREHIDKVMNCEDIAMNFLVSHITRKPPLKTTSKWTIRCPECQESLSQDESHFQERHECIRLFTKIYGYNPLKFTQFRADSVLFKTRLGAGEQKCYTYV